MMAAQEAEIKFLQVNHDVVRRTLRKLHAKQVYEARLMRRLVFDWPERTTDSFVRVRDEGSQVTVTYKAYEDDREIEKLETTVGSFEVATLILQRMGATLKSQQESKREEWQIDGCKVQLDE